MNCTVILYTSYNTRQKKHNNVLNVEPRTSVARDHGDNDDTYNDTVPKYQIDSNNETINLDEYNITVYQAINNDNNILNVKLQVKCWDLIENLDGIQQEDSEWILKKYRVSR